MDISHSAKEIRIIRTAFLLSIAIRTTTALLENFPHDTNATVGQNVTLPCKTSLEYTVYWYFNGEEIFYGGKVSMSFQNKFKVESREKGEYNLIISPADESYTGVYECGDDEGQGERRSARLHVTVATTVASAESTGSGNERIIIIIPIVVGVVVIGIGVGVLVYYCCKKSKKCYGGKTDDPRSTKENKTEQAGTNEVGWTTESNEGKVDAANNIEDGVTKNSTLEKVDTTSNITVEVGVKIFGQRSEKTSDVLVPKTGASADDRKRGDQTYSRNEAQCEEGHALLNSPEDRGGAEQDASITTYSGAMSDDSVVGNSAVGKKYETPSTTPRNGHEQEPIPSASAKKEREQNTASLNSSKHDLGDNNCEMNSSGDDTEEIEPSNNNSNHSGNSGR